MPPQRRLRVSRTGGVFPLGAEFVPECEFDLFPELVHLLGQELEVELAQLPRHDGVIIEAPERAKGFSGTPAIAVRTFASGMALPTCCATTSAPVAISPQATSANFILAKNMTFIAPSTSKPTDVEVTALAANLPEA